VTAIEVLRIGQRLVRDDRVTTHVALVSRAFGASRIYMTEANPGIRGAVQQINRRWGGTFEVTYVEGWRSVLQQKKSQNYVIIHLSMYGEAINSVQEQLRSIHRNDARNILVVVGAKKVPRDVYEAADYNVSVGGQPHSEIAALAVLLDRINGGRQFEDGGFENAMFRIVPSSRNKNVAGPGRTKEERPRQIVDSGAPG